MQLNDDQLAAIRRAKGRRLSVINGGAGTGKTTVIREIVREIGGNSLLCCPTGKAAARLREASGLDASTIHSALKYNGEGFMLKSLAGTSLIVDEASMVDSELMAEICRRGPARLILVGDEAQLMPVGNGAPFHDLIRLRPDLVSTLNQCYRNTEAIFKAATAIRAGQAPQKFDQSAGELWRINHTGRPEPTQEIIVRYYKEGQVDPAQDIVLVCRNGERGDPAPGTVHAINTAALAALGFDPEPRWQPGQRIICLKNFAALDVWNGTTGTITGVNKDGAWVKGDIPFHDAEQDCMVDEIQWPLEVLRSCQHAYALTVHKSQGSQYRNVFFACFSADAHMMLSRPLIYTAVTRARKNCVVLGDARAFAAGIGICPQKTTVLQELAREAAAGKAVAA
jgi:exodeoxyribonuclease V alpha subunit